MDIEYIFGKQRRPFLFRKIAGDRVARVLFFKKYFSFCASRQLARPGAEGMERTLSHNQRNGSFSLNDYSNVIDSMFLEDNSEANQTEDPAFIPPTPPSQNNQRSAANDSFHMLHLAEQRVLQLTERISQLAQENASLQQRVSNSLPANSAPETDSKVATLQAENLALIRRLDLLAKQKFTEAVEAVTTADTANATEQERESLYSNMTVLIAKLNGRRLEQDAQLEEHLQSVRKLEVALLEAKEKIAAAQEKEATALEKVAKAQKMIDALDLKMDKLVAAEADVKAQGVAQLNRAEELAAQLDTIKRANAHLTRQETVLTEHIRAQDEELKRHAKQTENLLRERSSFSEQIKGLSEKISALQQEKESARKEAGVEMTALVIENQGLRIDMQNIQASLTTAKQAVEAKGREKENLLSLYTDLMGKNESLLLQVRQLEERKNVPATPVASTIVQKKDFVAETRLKEERDTLQKDVAKREKQLKKVLDEKSVLLQQLDALRSRIASCESEKITLSEAVTRQKLLLSQQEASILALESQIQSQKATILAAESKDRRKEDASNRISALTESIAIAKGKISALERELSERDQQLAHHQSTASLLNQRNSNLEQEQHRLMVMLEQERDHSAIIERSSNTIKTQLADQQREVQVLRSEVEELKRDDGAITTTPPRRTTDNEVDIANAFQSLRTNTAEKMKSLKESTDRITRSTPIAPQRSNLGENVAKSTSFQSRLINDLLGNAMNNLQRAKTAENSPISSIADPNYNPTSSPTLTGSSAANGTVVGDRFGEY